MALSVDFFDDRDDAALLAHARSGDSHSADVLWIRLRPAALAVARRIAENHHDAEDLASEALAKVFAAIADGNGPTDAVFPYLCTTMRNLHVSNLRRRARAGTPLDLDEERVLSLVSPSPDMLESDLVTRAFGELPERWRYVLWASLVEGRPGHEVAADLGIRPAAVHALKSRALEGLRQQYLAAHARLCEEQECADVHRVLAAIARGKAKRSTDLGQVWKHLRTCEHCAEGYREITAINNRIGSLLGPAAAAAVTLAPATGIGGTAGLLRVPTEAGKVAVAAGVAGVIALGGTALTLDRSPSPGATSASPPAAVAAPVTSSAATPSNPGQPQAAADPTPAAQQDPGCLRVDLEATGGLAGTVGLAGRLGGLLPTSVPPSDLDPACVGAAPAPPVLLEKQRVRQLVPDVGRARDQLDSGSPVAPVAPPTPEIPAPAVRLDVAPDLVD